MDETKMGALGRMVTEVDGEGPEALAAQEEQAQQEATALSEAKAWAQVPFAVGKLLCMVAPELEPVYSEAACQAWGESVVPVAQKYGWSASVFPEIALAITTAGFAIPSYLVARAKLAALKEAAAAAPRQVKGAADGG